MRILIVMSGFFPGQKYGGPPVSVDNFCTLMNDHECFIITRNHEMGDSEEYSGIKSGWNEREYCKVLYLSDKEYGYKKFEDVVNSIHPEIIYLQGLFQKCIIPCLFLAKRFQIPVILAPRGELCGSAFKKKYKKIPYIFFLKVNGLLKNIFYQSTSDEETKAINKYLGVNSSRIHYLTNIPSIPKKKYKRAIKKVGQGKFVYLSRIHPKKNLISAIRYFNGVNGDVTFDIYGPLEDVGYWKECQQEIAKLPANVKVKYCGLVSHDDVHEVFSKYEAFLFPTFSENYGHVIAEALIVGTPVIIGKGTTPWDDVNGVAGFVCDLAANQLFTGYLNQIVSMDNDAYIELIRSVNSYINRKLNLVELKNSYEKVLEQTISRDGV